MKSFAEYIKQEMGIEMPKGNISGEWFYQHNLPMVMRCSCCDMTMASPSVWVDDEEYTYCVDCANVEEE